MAKEQITEEPEVLQHLARTLQERYRSLVAADARIAELERRLAAAEQERDHWCREAKHYTETAFELNARIVELQKDK